MCYLPTKTTCPLTVIHAFFDELHTVLKSQKLSHLCKLHLIITTYLNFRAKLVRLSYIFLTFIHADFWRENSNIFNFQWSIKTRSANNFSNDTRSLINNYEYRRIRRNENDIQNHFLQRNDDV